MLEAGTVAQACSSLGFCSPGTLGFRCWLEWLWYGHTGWFCIKQADYPCSNQVILSSLFPLLKSLLNVPLYQVRLGEVQDKGKQNSAGPLMAPLLQLDSKTRGEDSIHPTTVQHLTQQSPKQEDLQLEVSRFYSEESP